MQVFAVASPLVATHAITWLLAVTRLFVTVMVVPAAAMFTRPVGLLMVWFPVVPGAVIVEGRNWLRVSGATKLSQVDQGIRQQLHPIMPLLDALKT
jgi:hypothetical protein